MDGFIVIDKPAGITSHDVIRRARKILGTKKIGHTGTLDPFATGVLPLAVGEGTKGIQFLDESEKEYRATLRLGAATDTQDCTGVITSEWAWEHLAPAEVQDALEAGTGTRLQVPPMYSAVKKDGVPMYRLARSGLEVEREAREIEIFSLRVEEVALPFVTFVVRCSRGTYVRTLAHDFGVAAGCGAHLTALRRTRSGIFAIEEALSLERLEEMAAAGRGEDALIPLHRALGHLPECRLTAEGARRIGFGISPGGDDAPGCAAGGTVRLCSPEGALLAAAAAEGAGPERRYRLLRVFR